MKCEDCGDDFKRRTRCKTCGKLVCRWCYHHIHGGKLLGSGIGAIDDKVADLQVCQVRQKVGGAIARDD